MKSCHDVDVIMTAYVDGEVEPAEAADFDLLDVRQCLYDEGAMAHVLCEWRGQPVSLFVVPGRTDREQLLEIVGHDAVIWSGDGNTYVLVTEQRSGGDWPGCPLREAVHGLRELI
jgi:anti-sigma factor RsiW